MRFVHPVRNISFSMTHSAPICLQNIFIGDTGLQKLVPHNALEIQSHPVVKRSYMIRKIFRHIFSHRVAVPADGRTCGNNQIGSPYSHFFHQFCRPDNNLLPKSAPSGMDQSPELPLFISHKNRNTIGGLQEEDQRITVGDHTVTVVNRPRFSDEMYSPRVNLYRPNCIFHLQIQFLKHHIRQIPDRDPIIIKGPGACQGSCPRQTFELPVCIKITIPHCYSCSV